MTFCVRPGFGESWLGKTKLGTNTLLIPMKLLTQMHLPNLRGRKLVYAECFDCLSLMNPLKKILVSYAVGSKSFRPDIQKPRQMENAVRDI